MDMVFSLETLFCVLKLSTLKKFFGRDHHLTLPYRVSVTTMANDICRPWYCCHEYISFLDTT